MDKILELLQYHAFLQEMLEQLKQRTAKAQKTRVTYKDYKEIFGENYARTNISLDHYRASPRIRKLLEEIKKIEADKILTHQQIFLAVIDFIFPKYANVMHVQNELEKLCANLKKETKVSLENLKSNYNKLITIIFYQASPLDFFSISGALRRSTLSIIDSVFTKEGEVIQVSYNFRPSMRVYLES